MSFEASERTMDNIRDVNRKHFDLIRRDRRYKTSTIQRGSLDQLNPRNYSQSDIHAIAITLKKKKGVDRKFLTELSQALALSEQNATAFINVDGALQALCSFLTGGDSVLQLETAYCVANLCLWEDEKKCTSPVTSVTSAYFITLLGSGNSCLQEACIWALGNMLPQGKTILAAQGLLDKLVDLLTSPFGNVRTSAVQCLLHLITTCSPMATDLVQIAGGVLNLLDQENEEITSLHWLFYALSCHECCDVILGRVITWSLIQLRKELSSDQKVTNLVPLIRLLGNACAARDDFVTALLREKNLSSMVIQLLNMSYEPICKETLLLVANMANNSNSEIQSLFVSSGFRSNVEKSLVHVSALF